MATGGTGHRRTTEKIMGIFAKTIDWGAWIAVLLAWFTNFDNVKGFLSFVIGAIAGIYLILHNRQKYLNEKRKAEDDERQDTGIDKE